MATKHKTRRMRRPWWRRYSRQLRFLALAATALVLAAVLVFWQQGGGARQSTLGTTSSESGSVPDFAVQTLDGATFQLSAYRGKPVAIFAMAGWCASCAQEAQAWSEVYPDYQDRGLELLVLSVDPNDTPGQLASFQSWSGSGQLPRWAIDKDGSIARKLNIQTLDQTLLVDPAGKVAYTDYQPSTASQLRQALDSLLNS